MTVRKFILKETRIIAIGECIGVAAMWGIYALLGHFDRTVLLGGIVGAVISVLNFFFMAVSADMAADRAMNQDVKSGKKIAIGGSITETTVLVTRHTPSSSIPETHSGAPESQLLKISSMRKNKSESTLDG